MFNNTRLGFLIFLIMFGFTAACSKQLTPPEIESVSSASESGIEGSGSSDNASAFQGGAGEGFSEEGISESGALGGPPVITGDAGSGSGFGSNSGSSAFGRGGNGSEMAPFDGGDNSAEGIQEARLLPFRSSSDLRDIHFKFDKYDLDSHSKEILRQNASYLKGHPGVRIEIQGHADERGTNNYNIALGERRATATKQFLKTQGVDETRIHIISYGEEKPFCFESNESCWEQNRRAHFLAAE